MIAVIADDFTGAAEIGGLGLKYKLRVEMETSVKSSSNADLLVIATDTRSKNVTEAVRDVETITARLMELKPSLIYKKIDSVLRGHILEELAVQMRVSGKRKALVIPANPALGRVIKDGIYYLNGQQLHESGFGHDPDFMITSSRVSEILRKEDDQVTVANFNDDMPEAGIVIGEATSVNDFQRWLGKAGDDFLLAGASGFFAAILAKKGILGVTANDENGPAFGQKMLFACGSSFSTSKNAVEKAFAMGAPVSIMPRELAEMEGEGACFYQEQWASEVVSLFKSKDHVILYPGPINDYRDKLVASRVCRNTAMAIRKIMQRVKLQELMVEGGSTASAVLNALGIEKCFPVQELAQGVIRMRVPENEDLHVTLKPGSYPWPSGIWDFGVETD